MTAPQANLLHSEICGVLSNGVISTQRYVKWLFVCVALCISGVLYGSFKSISYLITWRFVIWRYVYVAFCHMALCISGVLSYGFMSDGVF